MPTQVDDTGLQFLATYLASLAVTISVHTNDPGPTGADNELPHGAGRNYRTGGGNPRYTEAAGDWNRDGTASDNDNDIDVFTPTATEQGTVCRYIGIRFGAVWYGRIQLVAPVTLVAGRPFTLAAGTVDLNFAR